MIEEEIFKRKKIRYDLLEKCGFIRTKGGYLCERKIYPGMIARVSITSDGVVTGCVFDEDFGEPYVNHRLEGAEGAFVVGVRSAYEVLLREIAAAVTEDKRYLYDQTERVDGEISQRYGVSPEFLWEKFPGFGVYRHAENRKWFAIIMNIAKGKLFPDATGEVEAINLKLDRRAEEYLRQGALPAYHMNHKSWVTVPLDDSLPDDLIYEMIDISYENTLGKGKK